MWTAPIAPLPLVDLRGLFMNPPPPSGPHGLRMPPYNIFPTSYKNYPNRKKRRYERKKDDLTDFIHYYDLKDQCRI